MEVDVEAKMHDGSKELEAADIQSVRPTMKERQRQFREEAILDAAEELLRTKGFNAMTLEDITEAIGISRPTLYLHFNSKEDVVISVGIRSIKCAIEFLKNENATASAIDRIRKFMDWSMQMRFGAEEGMVLCELTSVLLTRGRENEVYTLCDVELAGLLVNLLREAQVSGDVRDDIDPLLLMETVRGLFKSPYVDRMIAENKTTPEGIADAAMKLLRANSKASK